jgi:AraC-like DNA-binding protein
MLTISSPMARRLMTLARALGVDPVELCRRHRLDQASLEDRASRVPLDNVLSGLEELERTNPPTLGLTLAQNAEPAAYHTPALVLLASDTLREGFARAFALQRLWGDGNRFALAEPRALGREDAGLAVTFRIPSARRTGHAILEVCALAETMAGARALTGRSTEAALAVGFPSVSDDVAELTRFFGVVPEVGVERAFVVLSDSLLDARLSSAHALFLAVFERQAREELASLPPEGDLLEDVRAQIRRGLVRGHFALSNVADALGISPRTLERRLTERGERYQELVESIRRDLASRLLDGTRSVGEVATLLGYTERSSFHRAFVRWFGQTPAAFQQDRRPIQA